MKNYKKGSVVPVLLVVIGLLIVGGGAYLFTQKIKTVKVTDIVPSGVASTSVAIISGEYIFSDMTGLAFLHVPNTSTVHYDTHYFFGDESSVLQTDVQSQIVGDLSPLSDSCTLSVEATVEIQNPKLILHGEKRNLKEYRATFLRLISKGKVYDNCAGDGGVVTKTERK